MQATVRESVFIEKGLGKIARGLEAGGMSGACLHPRKSSKENGLEGTYVE